MKTITQLEHNYLLTDIMKLWINVKNLKPASKHIFHN
jgi:hypothetical protein